MREERIWLVVAVVSTLGCIVGASFLGAVVVNGGAPEDGTPACWTDPDPHVHLDFDFHTFVGGRPVRCGYLEPKPGSVLPRVLGEEDRAVYSDIMCYPMKAIPCSK